MNNEAVLRISQLRPDDADELLEFVQGLQGEDCLRPVTIVAPSNYALLSLRHRLGRTGFANVQFMVFDRLAELLGAPSLSTQGKRPLTPVFFSAVVRSVASEATGTLERVRDHPSTHLSLRNTFRQLRHADDKALDELAERGGLRAETVKLYRRFREGTQGFYDYEDLAEAAAEAVRAGSAPGLRDLGFIVFFRMRGLMPSQKALTKALADAGQCAALLGETGDAQADEATRAFAEYLRPALGEAQTRPGEREAASTQDSHLLIAPDAHQEVRWVIRRIMQRAEAGTPFHRMAVLYRKQMPYGTLIREELALAGIQVAGPNPSSLADTAVGNALLGLLGLAEAQFARESVMSWLTGCPIKAQPGIEVSSFNPSLWDTISKRANVVRGVEQWRERLEQFARNQEENATEWSNQGEIYEARAYRMRSDAEAARQLLKFIVALIKAADPSGIDSWLQRSEWTKALLDKYLAYGELQESERRAYERIERILDELKTLDGISLNEPESNEPESFDVFRRALSEALQASVGHLGAVGHGVFVGPIRLAAGMNFDVAHIVGMIEGAAPPAIRDDPLIPEHDRIQAGGAGAGLPLQQQHRDDERYEYLAALATAPQHTLSYPVADPSEQRVSYPSRWLLEKASELEGSHLASFALGALNADDRAWLTRIVSMERSLDTARDVAYADAHDYNLERLQVWQDAGLSAAQHPLNREGLLERTLRLTQGRQSGAITEWDGDLSAVADGARFVKRLVEQSVSPTSLERWAKCPFSYFLGVALGLSSDDSPEDVYTISPLEKGSLIHSILERFIRERIERGTLPRPDAKWGDDDRERLHDIAKDEFGKAEKSGVTGRALMWRIVKEEIIADLEAFLENDSEMRKKQEVTPASVERTFGLGADGWKEAFLDLPDGDLPDDKTLKFRGKIDRVDTAQDGGNALVLDYKTGSFSSYRGIEKDPIDQGKHLQLAIYSLAAGQGLGGGHAVSAAYWFVTSRGEFRLIPSEPLQIADGDVRERFMEGMLTITDGIRGGMFPANPGKWDGRASSGHGFENCVFCDFSTLCPSNRDRHWERKRRDPRVAAYVRLAEPEE